LRKLLLFMMLLIVWLTVSILPAQEYEYLGLQNRQITSLGIYDGILAVGTQEDGVFWHTLDFSDGSEWNLIGLQGQNVLTVYPHKSGPIGWGIGAGMHPNESGDSLVYCSYMGEPFEPNNQGFEETAPAIYDLDGFPDPSICGETYAAAGHALYIREWGEDTWTPIYTVYEGSLITVSARVDFPGVVLAGGSEGFAGHLLIKSTDYGETWENISPMSFIVDVDFVGARADTIFAVAGQYVYRSFDGGSEWEIVFAVDIPEYPSFSEVLVDLSNNRVYIAGYNIWGGQTSPLYSDDWGESWTPILSGRYDPIVGIAASADGDMYVAYESSGIFRIDPEFNFSTEIRFRLDQPAHTRLQIFNAIGQPVKTLLNGAMQAGKNSVIWDGSNEANELTVPGVYYYRLQTENFQRIERMVLAR